MKGGAGGHDVEHYRGYTQLLQVFKMSHVFTLISRLSNCVTDCRLPVYVIKEM